MEKTLTTRTSVAALAAGINGLVRDLDSAQSWLSEIAEDLANAGACTPSLYMPHWHGGDRDDEDKAVAEIRVQCLDRDALAAVARILMRGAGKGAVTKGIERNTVTVTRRIGLVSVAGWVPRYEVCQPLTGMQTGWDCGPLLRSGILPGVERTEGGGE